jgi:hypothetical protein
MKYKTKKTFVKYFSSLSWYVVCWDSSSCVPKYLNVLRCIDAGKLFSRLTYKGAKPNRFNCISSQEDFYEYIHVELRSVFLGNANYEMKLSGLFGDNDYKLSVYAQLFPNLHHIINYLILELGLDYDFLCDVQYLTNFLGDVSYV